VQVWCVHAFARNLSSLSWLNPPIATVPGPQRFCITHSLFTVRRSYLEEVECVFVRDRVRFIGPSVMFMLGFLDGELRNSKRWG
jgi:hypothetical protein